MSSVQSLDDFMRFEAGLDWNWDLIYHVRGNGGEWTEQGMKTQLEVRGWVGNDSGGLGIYCDPQVKTACWG
jgi:hypothetical protein